MKTITIEEMRAYILAQPDDKPVRMREFTSEHNCGCLMVHYGRDVLGFRDFSCGAVGFYEKVYAGGREAVLKFEMRSLIFRGLNCDAETYGELKGLLIS
jgi:hypothetical protein